MSVTVDAGLHHAVLFDLDGVITDTASVHFAAWKNLFDDYLARLPPGSAAENSPFTDDDYRRFVDGRPRYDGVDAFLRSRGHPLPWGDPADPDDAETVCGLGNRKNRYFHQRLRTDGVRVFDSSVALVRRLQDSGVGTAVFSASRNCGPVLRAAGLGELFDVRVDGVVAAELGLPGKPDPAVLLEAARRVGAHPAHTVVVEDAEAGAAAGRRGGFALVVGVDRTEGTGHAEALRRLGADAVVTDLAEVRLRPRAETLARIPHALRSWDAVAGVLRGRDPAVFCDFDGTLSEIVPVPADAVLAEGLAPVLRRLARCCPVAVVSGRALADVRDRVDLPGIWYAGCHGFEIDGPNGEHFEYEAARDALPVLAESAGALRDRLATVPGALVEDKRFAVAVHYRNVEPDSVAEVLAAVREAGDRPGVRITGGRKVAELRPDIDWDKGTALWWLLERLSDDAGRVLPVYAGDDLTDEDAFAAVRDRGLGIAVSGGQRGDRPSSAHVAVTDSGELQALLTRVAELAESRGTGR